MKKKDRIYKAARHERSDIIPYHVDFTDNAKRKIAAHYGDDNFAEKIGNHFDWGYYSGGFRVNPRDNNYFIDDFGTQWNRGGDDHGIGVNENFVIPEPNMSLYTFPEPNMALLKKQFEQMFAHGQDTFKLGGIGFSLFERAWALRGMQNLLTDMITEPAFVHRLLDAICEYDMRIMDVAMEFDLDGFYFGDDWGQQQGTVMGPQLWRTFIKPPLKRLYQRAKNKGLIVLQHSCGDIEELFDDLIEIGLDVYQTVQPDIYDLADIKRRYGAKLTFWGGISTQSTLPYGTPEQVKTAIIETLKLLGDGGGYIAGPTHTITGDIPQENIGMMLDIFQHQHRYL